MGSQKTIFTGPYWGGGKILAVNMLCLHLFIIHIMIFSNYVANIVNNSETAKKKPN